MKEILNLAEDMLVINECVDTVKEALGLLIREDDDAPVVIASGLLKSIIGMFDQQQLNKILFEGVAGASDIFETLTTKKP